MTEQPTPNLNDNRSGGLLSGILMRMGILGELFAFLWAAKMWWLIPMVVALVVFGLLIALGASGAAGSLIYTLF